MYTCDSILLGFHVYLKALQALHYFKVHMGDKPFTLTQCWWGIEECPKWHETYASYKKACQRNKYGND
jgi:hypothetical protein